MQDRFTSRDVISLTGITARQLQWWDERGVVKPEREGHRRLYSFDRLTEVAVICELRRKGFSLQGVRKVMRFLDREFGKGLAEIVDRNSEYHPAHRRQSPLSRNFGAPDCRYSQELEPADSRCLFERRRAAGAGRGRLPEGEYFGNFARCP
jgi:DNA-binding transcriptional MerR regulator